jgi:hypothetical protein
MLEWTVIQTNQIFQRITHLLEVTVVITIFCVFAAEDFGFGEIYIPATYFNFVGSLRSLCGLFWYGDVLEDNHQVASIE